MSKWITAAENALEGFGAETGVPYEFERFECEEAQLPESYVVYFLVTNPPSAWYDGAESSSQARLQVSFYYRRKSEILTVPEKLISYFKAEGFMRSGEGRIPYQKDTGHYGWRCEFTYYERGN